jgi:hypothetical protein
MSVAEIIRPQSFPPAQSPQAHTFAEVALQDIGADGFIRPPEKRVEVDDRNFAKVTRQRLEPGDLIVSVRGRVGDVGMAPPDMEQDGLAGWLASQTFVIVRLRKSSPIRTLALHRYLSSPLGRGLLQSLTAGATVPMVSMGDLRRLKIMIPTPAQEQDIERTQMKVRELRRQIAKLERLTDELNAASWPMTEMRNEAE